MPPVVQTVTEGEEIVVDMSKCMPEAESNSRTPNLYASVDRKSRSFFSFCGRAVAQGEFKRIQELF